MRDPEKLPHYDLASRLIHLALALLGVAAIISGQFAGDYKRSLHTGFTVHEWIGLGMAGAIGVRLLWGIAGPRDMRFSQWFPVTRARMRLVGEDLAALARLQLPERERHLGLSGLVQAFGLLAFTWTAVTGVLLYAYLEPGARAAGAVRLIKELHEGAQAVLLGYLALHVGAVLLHAVVGHPVWRRMLP
jgi:cytochrome b